MAGLSASIASALGAAGVACAGVWSCALVSGVDQLQEVTCLEACDAAADAPNVALDGSSGTGDAQDGSSATGDVQDGSSATGDASPAGDSGGAASPYRAAVLSDSPLGYWRLGEAVGSTTCHDETGNGHDGTVMGGVTFGVPGALPHDPNPAAQFDGTGTINVGTAFTFAGADPFTWEIWVNPAVLGDDVYIPFFSSMTYEPNGNPVDGTYMVSYSSGGDTFGFERYNGGANAVVALDTPGLMQGQWTYIVATMDASGTGTVYVNGALVLTAAGNGTVPVYTAPTEFGSMFKGVLDEIAIYDHPLASDRVTAHWNAASE
jgi:large repetitive protein